MSTVNQTIQRILREKDAGIVSGTEAMRGILEDLRRQVLGEIERAAAGSWDAYRLKQALNAIETQIANYALKSQAEASGLVEDLWGMGRNLVDSPLRVAGLSFGFSISTGSLDALKDMTNTYLESALKDAWFRVKGEITLGIMGVKSPQEVADAIGRNLTGKSIFSSIAERAEVITQTEMGRAFSQAAQFRMYQASQYVPDLEKQWIHAGHPKQARPTHVAAHGQHVKVGDAFRIGGIKMMHPRDAAAPLSEVIRCGCDHVPYHARWA